MKTETLLVKRPKFTAARATRAARKATNPLKIKNILVPLDFSLPSHAAIRFAVPLLKRFSANLHLVHVSPTDSPLSGLADLPMVVPEIEFGPRIRRDLGKAAASYAIKTQPGHLHVLKGTPFAEICQLAWKIEIDLIIISTRGNTGLKHLALGSTAERVVRYSPCPVLVVRGNTQTKKASRDGKTQHALRYRKILVPIDFSDCSMKALGYAKALAKEFGSTLVLLHSVHMEYYVSSDEYARYDFPLLMAQSEKAAKAQMHDLARQAKGEGFKVETALEIGHPGDQICSRAQSREADLIVISTHGRTGLKHILIGSTAEFVARHSPCPVLVVPSHGRPAITTAKTQT